MSSLSSEEEKHLVMIRKDPWHYRDLPDTFKADKDFTQRAIIANREVIRDINSDFLEDDKFVSWLTKAQKRSIYFIPMNMRENKNFIFILMDQHIIQPQRNQRYIPLSLRDDMQVAMKMLEYGFDPRLLSQRLRNKRKVAMKILEKGFPVHYFSKRLRNDKSNLSRALEINPLNLKYEPGSLRDNEDFMMKMISDHPDVFKYASKRLKNNKRVISLAISKSLNNKDYIPAKLWADYQFALFLVSEVSPCLLEFVPKELKNDPEIV